MCIISLIAGVIRGQLGEGSIIRRTLSLIESIVNTVFHTITFNLFRSEGTLKEKPDGSERTFQHPPTTPVVPKVVSPKEVVSPAGPKTTKVQKPPKTLPEEEMPEAFEEIRSQFESRNYQYLVSKWKDAHEIIELMAPGQFVVMTLSEKNQCLVGGKNEFGEVVLKSLSRLAQERPELFTNRRNVKNAFIAEWLNPKTTLMNRILSPRMRSDEVVRLLTSSESAKSRSEQRPFILWSDESNQPMFSVLNRSGRVVSRVMRATPAFTKEELKEATRKGEVAIHTLYYSKETGDLRYVEEDLKTCPLTLVKTPTQVTFDQLREKSLGVMSSVEANQLLAQMPGNAWLIRGSESTPGVIVLNVIYHDGSTAAWKFSKEKVEEEGAGLDSIDNVSNKFGFAVERSHVDLSTMVVSSELTRGPFAEPEIYGTNPLEVFNEIGGPSSFSRGKLIADDLTYRTASGAAFCRDHLYSLKHYYPKLWATLPVDLRRNLEANQEERSIFPNICSNSETQVQVKSGAFVHANEYVGEQKYVMAQYPMDHEAYWEHVFDEMSDGNHCVLVNLAAKEDILGTSERGFIDKRGNAPVGDGPSRFRPARGYFVEDRIISYPPETKEQNFFWPRELGQTRFYGSYTVKNTGKRLVKEEGECSYEVLDLQVIDAKGKVKTLKMINCPSWKDFSGADDTMVLDLLREAHSEIEAHSDQPTTIKVNCQAGVGRTGEFVALLDQSLKMKKSVRKGKRELDFSRHHPRAIGYQVRKMRYARGSDAVVQTPQQFEQLCRMVRGMFQDYYGGRDPLAKAEEVEAPAPSPAPSPVPTEEEKAFDVIKKYSSEFIQPKHDKLLMEDSIPIGSWYLRRDGEALIYVCKEVDINGRKIIKKKRIQRTDLDLPKTVGECREKYDPEKRIGDEKIRALWIRYLNLIPKEKRLKEFEEFIGTNEVMSFDDRGLLSVKPGTSRTIILPDKGGYFDYKVIKISRAVGAKRNTHLYHQVRVTYEGKIQCDGRAFGSFDAFRSAFDIKHPLSAQEFKRLNTHNQFAHAWGLKGYIDRGDGIGFDKEGSFHEISAQTLMDQLDGLEFPSGMDNYFNEPDVKEAMRRALKDCIELRRLRFAEGTQATVGKLIELISASDAKNTPVLIPTGYSGHAVYMTYYREVLAITNRGARHSNNRSGTHYFKVDPDVLISKIKSPGFAKKFLGHGINSDTFKEFQPYENRWAAKGYGGEMMSALGLTPLGVDEKAGQKVGNCTFANCIAAMHAIATLKSIKDRPLGHSTIVSRAGEYKVDYKAFTFAVRAGVLGRASTQVGLETSEFHDDFVDAYGKMGAKLKNYEDREKFAKGSKRADIVRICEYYRAKVDGLTEDNLEVRKQVEFIEKVPLMHYSGMSQHDTRKVLETRSVGSWLVRRVSSQIFRGVYEVGYKRADGHVDYVSLPSQKIKTMEDFEKRFKKDMQVPTSALPAEKQELANLYLKAQELSVGKMSSTEAQLQLKGQDPGTWLVRESRTIRGLFVVERVDKVDKVDRSCEVISTRLDENNLKGLIGKFDDEYPRTKIATLKKKEEILNIGSSVHIPRANYVRLSISTQRRRRANPSPFSPSRPRSVRSRFSIIPSPVAPTVQVFREFERYGSGRCADLKGVLMRNLPHKDFTLSDIERVKRLMDEHDEEPTPIDPDGFLRRFIDQMAEMTAFRDAEITDNEMEVAMMKDTVPNGSWYLRHSSDPLWFVIFVKDTDNVERHKFKIAEFEERMQLFESRTYKYPDLKTKIAGRFSLPEDLQKRVERARSKALSTVYREEMNTFKEAGITDDEMKEAMKDAPDGSWYPRLSSDSLSFVIIVKDTDRVIFIKFVICEFEERIHQFRTGTYSQDGMSLKIGDKFSLSDALKSRLDA